ncbi:hypothetical protein F7725_011298 [Dissostichus mawsoni]|uniref:Uncharacterized protein n=1 Tax=Dissostichus mawsoni TaxID=36200 RepID=A0A7J5ZBP6_DISMA|nr:hypothetical protein F7725_011298 [Dissostichus mawsoni]
MMQVRRKRTGLTSKSRDDLAMRAGIQALLLKAFGFFVILIITAKQVHVVILVFIISILHLFDWSSLDWSSLAAAELRSALCVSAMQRSQTGAANTYVSVPRSLLAPLGQQGRFGLHPIMYNVKVGGKHKDKDKNKKKKTEKYRVEDPLPLGRAPAAFAPLLGFRGGAIAASTVLTGAGPGDLHRGDGGSLILLRTAPTSGLEGHVASGFWASWRGRQRSVAIGCEPPLVVALGLLIGAVVVHYSICLHALEQRALTIGAHPSMEELNPHLQPRSCGPPTDVCVSAASLTDLCLR